MLGRVLMILGVLVSLLGLSFRTVKLAIPGVALLALGLSVELLKAMERGERKGEEVGLPRAVEPPVCSACGRKMIVYPLPDRGVIAYYCPSCDRQEEK